MKFYTLFRPSPGVIVPKTIMRAMKLTFLIFTTCLIQVSASSLAQKITLSEKNASLSKIIKDIRKQSGFDFLADTKLIKQAKPISVNIKDVNIDEALKACLYGQQINFTIENKIILLTSKDKIENVNNNVISRIDVTGKVLDEKGKPIPGASVKIKGTSLGVTTDIDGVFKLKNLDENALLIVSFIGYNSVEIKAGKTEVVVTLVPQPTSLNEVVVIGYGTQKKGDLTGSVSSVNQKDFTQGVNTNALQEINGKAAGVQVSQASSAPGGGVNIRVRGAGSINSSNDVLIVIDGLPGADPSSITPDDIESIEILKDASASAIYGSRAANGVVLITTKKGKIGKPNITYNAYVGLQETAKTIDVLNAQQYMQVLNSLSVAQNQAAPYTQAQIDTTKGTNWQNQIFKKAIAQNHQVSISGGSDYNKYYVGLNYLNQDGILKNTDFQRYNARLNYEITPSDKFNISLAANIDRSGGDIPYSQLGTNQVAGAINTSLYFDPTVPTALDANGRYQFNPLASLENPLAIVNGITNTLVKNNTYGTLIANYTPIEGLKFTARLGANTVNSRADYYNSQVTRLGFAAGGIGSVNTEQDTHWLMEYLVQYSKRIKDHNFSLLLGTTTERYDTETEGASSQGFLSDATLTNLLGSGNPAENVISSSKTVNKLNSYIGRFNYDYKDKYLLTASFRDDGTSVFSENHKYAFFPSVALGWKINKEKFLENASNISNLKLRLGYGEIGNQAIGPYSTIQTYIAGASAVLGNTVYQGAEPARLPNPDLRWETTAEYNIGLDFGLFNDRISGSVEYYIKNTYDQLFSKPTPAFTGFSSELVNFGNVRNTGFDILLTSKNISTANFKWNTTVTASFLNNKVTQLPSFIPQVLTGAYAFIPNYALVQTGYPMYSYYGYKVTGIFQTAAQASASGQGGAKAGDPIFQDTDHDGKITPADRVVLGSPLPKFTWGFDNNFAYKRFSLDILWLGAQGLSTFDDLAAQSLYPIDFERNRVAKYDLDRWTPTNTNAKYPSGINGSYGGQYSINSYTITDASFARLKTVTLTYQIPLKTSFAKAIAVYIAADNLLTISAFDGYDPDANANGGSIVKVNENDYPLARVYRLGVKVDF